MRDSCQHSGLAVKVTVTVIITFAPYVRLPRRPCMFWWPVPQPPASFADCAHVDESSRA